ncbi:MAG: transcription elongation factor GreA [Acidobacteria bacterium]|nr:transcription elongation factor GreA [Acidobacteriota bacterium]
MRRLQEPIEKELKELDRELRFDLPREIARATAMGDLRENAEYKAALERQSYVKARIAHLQQRLSQLSTIRLSQIPTDRIAFGSLVTVRDLDNDEERAFDLVLGDEGDANAGKISVASPIGRALLNKQVGDEVTVRTPAGERAFEIVSLQTLHERNKEHDEPGSPPAQ